MTGSTTITPQSQTAADEPVLTIDGEAQPGAAGTYPVHNPARPAEVVGHAPVADRAQLDAAVSAARRAAPGWRALSVAERVAAFAAAATTAAEQLAGRDGARLYTREHGKVLAEANFEISPRLPFGGCGQSGIGRELGVDGIRAFTQARTFVRHPVPH
jgi:acyl-CoA reductase-like NAD-dependent aldehyde dehydrogenase